MLYRDAIKILEQYNKWRRGDTNEVANPVDIGLAIDTVLKAHDLTFMREGETSYEHLQRLSAHTKIPIAFMADSVQLSRSTFWNWKKKPSNIVNAYARLLKSLIDGVRVEG